MRHLKDPESRHLLTSISGVADDARLAELHRVQLEFQNTGSRDLRETLVDAYRPLAMSLARRFSRNREPLDDLSQCALLALIHAVDRFDPGRGVKFTTFAWATISGELKRHLRDASWGVGVPRALQELHYSTRSAGGVLTAELGRWPTPAEVATRAGTTVERVRQISALSGARRPASLDARADVEADGADLLGASELGFDAVDNRLVLGSVVKRLGPKEQRMLYLRFVEERTQVQIGHDLGMGQMQVSRMLARSLASLRLWSLPRSA